MVTAVVDSTQIAEVLATKSIFKNKYLLVVPPDEDLQKIEWGGQGTMVRKVLIQKSDLLMTANPKSIQWGLGLKYPTVDDFVKEFKTIKPCIWGSDAHSYEELFVKNKERLLWIKADLTFDGLRQITLSPSRVFIGVEPDEKKYAETNPSLFLKKISVKRNDKIGLDEKWFDELNIELNTGLIAIIGNKGSGKSALADIIGLTGNSKKNASFSFLNNDRFNSHPAYRGKYFDAITLWSSGVSSKVNLSDYCNDLESEKVNYIPQNFLEKLCLTEVDKGLFVQELKKIIFSRLPIEKRFGKNSLDEVIKYKTEVVRNNIERIKTEIVYVNSKIVELEDQSRHEYKQKVYDDLVSTSHKYTLILSREPSEPNLSVNNKTAEADSEINEQIKKLRKSLEIVDEDIRKAISERDALAIQSEELTKAVQEFSSLKDHIDKTINTQAILLSSNGIKVNSIFSYSLDMSSIEDAAALRKRQLKFILDKLDSQSEYTPDSLSLYKYKNEIQQQIDSLQNKLDLPGKEYQTYLNMRSQWEQELSDVARELDKLESNRIYLDEILSLLLADQYKQRQSLLKKLFLENREIISIYKELYDPIIKFKNTYQQHLSSYEIDFDAAFEVKDFISRFDSFINYAKSGSFFSKESSHKKIADLISSTDFNDLGSIISFTSNIIRDLLYDTRDRTLDENDYLNHPKSVQAQLKQNIKPENFYDYLYNLEYIEPTFQLKLAGKEITALSPGERGALLLIFYLLLDSDTTPLIIDQPEENLDNQSIYSILVPFILEAKKRRQVILITHNPNLAVVCDAEQIIHVKIDKKYGNKITCTTGSIENPIINRLIIEVLEGTFPAFNIRNSRYEITRSRLGSSIYTDC